MHKIKLFDSECAVINGADKIIEAFGCFPSMENGRITRVDIRHIGLGRLRIVLYFDITGWQKTIDNYSLLTEAAGMESVLHFERIPDYKQRGISLSFSCVRDIVMHGFDSLAGECGEIKFSNAQDRTAIRQDGQPEYTQEPSRPFTGFAIRSGRDFFIEFFEDECEVKADLFDVQEQENEV